MTLNVLSTYRAIPAGPGFGIIQGAVHTVRVNFLQSADAFPPYVLPDGAELAVEAEFFTASATTSETTAEIHAPPQEVAHAGSHFRQLALHDPRPSTSSIGFDIPGDLWPDEIDVAEVHAVPWVVFWIVLADTRRKIWRFSSLVRRGPGSGGVALPATSGDPTAFDIELNAVVGYPDQLVVKGTEPDGSPAGLTRAEVQAIVDAEVARITAGGGVSTAQAQDIAGNLLATLAQFDYMNRVLSFQAGTTPTQARNAAGTLLATLSEFTYDPTTGALTFDGGSQGGGGNPVTAVAFDLDSSPPALVVTLTTGDPIRANLTALLNAISNLIGTAQLNADQVPDRFLQSRMFRNASIVAGFLDDGIRGTLARADAIDGEFTRVVHTSWANVNNGQVAAFQIKPLTFGSYTDWLTGGTVGQDPITDADRSSGRGFYSVRLRLARGSDVAKFRLAAAGARADGGDRWSEGTSDAQHDFYDHIGAVELADNAALTVQQSTSETEWEFGGNLTAAARARAGIDGAVQQATSAVRTANANHDLLADMAQTAVPSWALATEEEGGMALSADPSLDAAGAAALTYANELTFTAGTSPVNLYVRRDHDVGDTPSDFRVYGSDNQRPTLGTPGLFPDLGTVGAYAYQRFALDIDNLLPARLPTGQTATLRFEYHGSTRHTQFNGGLGGTATQQVDRAARDRYTDSEKAKLRDLPATLFDSTIASYDAAQDRFEDSSGDAVALVPGRIYLVTQAVYDAAVADSFSFPASVAFLTRAS